MLLVNESRKSMRRIPSNEFESPATSAPLKEAILQHEITSHLTFQIRGLTRHLLQLYNRLCYNHPSQESSSPTDNLSFPARQPQPHTMADSDEESLTSLQEYELDNGIPQHSDPFIQKYMAGRSALITQEKRQRHDRVFLSTMTPLAKRAAKILSAIRARELRTVWSSDNPDPRKPKVHPGMMFSLARDRAESTDLFRALEKMPKGALLHAHLDAMFEIDWLVDQNLATPGMCILAPERLDLSATEDRFSGSSFSIKYFSESDLAKSKGSKTIWEAGYIANTPTLL